MTKQKQDELHVLDRVMHLLEERSVERLVENDEAFSKFIADVYAKLDNRAMQLTTR